MSSRQNPFIEPISSVCHELNCLTSMKSILYLLSHVQKIHVQISLVTKYRQGLWTNIFPAQSLFIYTTSSIFARSSLANMLSKIQKTFSLCYKGSFLCSNEHYFPSTFLLILKGWTFKPLIILIIRELIMFLTCILSSKFPYRMLFIYGWFRSKAPGFPYPEDPDLSGSKTVKV